MSYRFSVGDWVGLRYDGGGADNRVGRVIHEYGDGTLGVLWKTPSHIKGTRATYDPDDLLLTSAPLPPFADYSKKLPGIGGVRATNRYVVPEMTTRLVSLVGDCYEVKTTTIGDRVKTEAFRIDGEERTPVAFSKQLHSFDHHFEVCQALLYGTGG